MNNLYNNLLLINQLIEQTKLNIARLINLENLVNKIPDLTDRLYIAAHPDNIISKCVNGYKLYSNIHDIKQTNIALANLLNANSLFANNNYIEDIVIDDTILNNTVISIKRIFTGCTNLKTVSFNNVVLNNLIDFSNVFDSQKSITTIDLTGLTINNNITNMDYTFAYMDNLVTLKMKNIPINNITSCVNTFANCRKLSTLEINTNFDKLEVSTFMFLSTSEHGNLDEVDFSNTTFDNLEIGYCMFWTPMKAKINIKNATFENLINGQGLFASYENVYGEHTDEQGNYTDIYLPKATFNNLTIATNMFTEHYNITTTINLPLATFKKVTNTEGMFRINKVLTTIYMPNATFESLETSNSNMFEDCPKLNTIYITEQGYEKIKSVLPDSGQWTKKSVEGENYIIATKQESQIDP